MFIVKDPKSQKKYVFKLFKNLDAFTKEYANNLALPDQNGFAVKCETLPLELEHGRFVLEMKTGVPGHEGFFEACLRYEYHELGDVISFLVFLNSIPQFDSDSTEWLHCVKWIFSR